MSTTSAVTAPSSTIGKAPAAAPRRVLSSVDAMAIILGIVIGAGIFKTPALVAANAGSELALILLWCAGGVISIIGALCYAELTTTYPSAGGDYLFLKRAFGYGPAFLFAWARVTVIQTGSVAMMAFVIGDYLAQLHAFGAYSSALYAAITILALTAINAAGVRQGKWTQNILTLAIVLGLVLVIGAGLMHLGGPAPAASAPAPAATGSAWGMAMIFVLLTYGGWNEAAYLSAELHDRKGSGRAMVRVLLGGICLITLIYLAVNLAFLRGLGLEGMAKSDAVASDLMRQAMGGAGAAFISLLIAIAALSTMNATIITGARSTYALGADYPIFSFFGRWREEASTPANAIWLQGVIALGLAGFGAFARSGFATMVEYTAPVFWFFFLLGGLSVFVLRRKDPTAPRPFRVPLYPLTPILFCLVCAYMLYSSLMYTGKGALIGVSVLLLGLPVLWLASRGRVAANAHQPNP